VRIFTFPWSGRRAGGNIGDLGGAARGRQKQRRQGSVTVALRDDLNLSALWLRRYARALVTGQPGPSEIADDLVHAVLLRTWEAGTALRLAGRDLHLHLYTLLTEWHRERLAAGRMGGKARMEKENFYAGGPRAAGTLPVPAAPRDKFGAALLALALEEREALLLVVLEGFSYAQAARILKISRTVLIMRLAGARAALSQIAAPEIPSRPAKARPSYLRVVK
jgi:RNA polymerase sigma-70 factor (ECF subfamily)